MMSRLSELFSFMKGYYMEDKDTSVLAELSEKINHIEERLNGMLLDIKRLEEENIETSNCLYELSNSIEAVDRRIDIVADDLGKKFNV